MSGIGATPSGFPLVKRGISPGSPPPKPPNRAFALSHPGWGHRSWLACNAATVEDALAAGVKKGQLRKAAAGPGLVTAAGRAVLRRKTAMNFARNRGPTAFLATTRSRPPRPFIRETAYGRVQRRKHLGRCDEKRAWVLRGRRRRRSAILEGARR